MGSYYYVKDKKSETGFIPIPEDDYIQAIFRIVKKSGINITGEMILKEFNRSYERRRVK